MGNTNRVWILMGKQLSGTINPQEVVELEGLLEQNPELWYSYELLNALNKRDEVPEAFLRELNSLLGDSVSPDQINTLISTKKLAEDNRRKKSRKLILYGSGFIFLAFTCVAGWFYTQKPANATIALDTMHEIVAPKGSKTQITLTDGTEIMLNAGSKLVYAKNFSMENREVYLTGEAYFKVVHDDKHSFIVHTPEADIVDLGTTFNVKAYQGSNTTETTLIEGSLEVVLKNNPSQKILIKPHEKVVLHNQLLSSTSKPRESQDMPLFEVSRIVPYVETNDIIETAWLSDKLIFRNKRFEELTGEMERKYNVNIKVMHEDVKSYEVTGIFENENIDEALKLLQVIVPFKYTIENEQILITE